MSYNFLDLLAYKLGNSNSVAMLKFDAWDSSVMDPLLSAETALWINLLGHKILEIENKVKTNTSIF